jgi:hypothetical protein
MTYSTTGSNGIFIPITVDLPPGRHRVGRDAHLRLDGSDLDQDRE